MRNLMLKHFMGIYALYIAIWIVFVSIFVTEFDYQLIQFFIGQVMYFLLLSVGIHHREMI